MAEAKRKTTLAERKEIAEYCILHDKDYAGTAAHYGADAVRAGNDVIMPGGPSVIAQIQKGYEGSRIARADLEKAVARLLMMVARCDMRQAETK